ncbi:MAG: hypothetical protein CSB48_13760 [Proteobacteria bacterium]|nr:MAG: hypothetical protein CSB48_13760 [Pseudomonadota bacterium]
MVDARSAFLNGGYYRPILDGLIEAASPRQAHTILDLGCGEGFYTMGLYDSLLSSGNAPGADFSASLPGQSVRHILGVDISREAIIASCRRYRNYVSAEDTFARQPVSPPVSLTWLVASGAALPVKSASVDLVTCLFTRIMPAEMYRVLSRSGKLVVAGAGENHLHELRSLLYSHVRQKRFSPEKVLSDQFVSGEKRRVECTICVEQVQQLKNLLMMTPHAWRVAPEKQVLLAGLVGRPISIDVELEVWYPAVP